jgi:hypothetical protein
LLEAEFGDRIVALVEHERRHAQHPEFAGNVAQLVDVLLDAVADEDDRVDAPLLRLCRQVTGRSRCGPATTRSRWEGPRPA